ncbi:hypothetical protein FSP39_019236 [Pinctada imbricata]|uniref:Uncharacterized protein n=1 Tax=Pinctada imbricata TaxID=66713 RepID=A0AA88YEY1_PINIB|nr:hypothetical protein FSP39_019236 [Pinctada imbricata]
MAYRRTPATESTRVSPFFALFGQEMRLPIDTALIPKPSLTRGHQLFLSDTIESMRLYHKIIQENSERAKQQNKEQYDRRAAPSTYRPGMKVWLFCSKVPTGISPKLHQKWTGPYTITQRGPNNTFELRRDLDNKILKSFVHSNRLKVYHDPSDRPEYLLDGYTDQDLDPEELHLHFPHLFYNTSQTTQARQTPSQQASDQQPNTHRTPQRQQPQSTQHVPHNQTTSTQNSPPSHSTQNTSQNQRTFDANRTYNESEIDKILKFSWHKKKPSYLVKLKDKTRSLWIYGSSLPQHMTNEFHQNYNAQGKRRKKKATNPKFFNREPQQNTSVHNRPTVSNITLNRSYHQPFQVTTQVESIKWCKGQYFFLIHGKWLHSSKVYKEHMSSCIETIDKTFDSCANHRTKEQIHKMQNNKIGAYSHIIQMTIHNGIVFFLNRTPKGQLISAPAMECVPSQVCQFLRRIHALSNL